MKSLKIQISKIDKAHLAVIVYVLAYLILFPSLHYKEYGISGLFDHKRWVQIGLLIFLSIVIICNSDFQKRIDALLNNFSYYVKFSLAGILVLGLISTLLSEFPVWALLEVGHYLLIIIMILLFVVLTQINKTVAKQVVILGVLGLVIFYLVRFSGSYILHWIKDFPLWPGQGFETGLYGFGNVRSFNHLQTWTLPLLTVLLWFKWEETHTAKYIYLFLLSFWWVLIIASGARGTALSILFAFGIICFILKSKSFPLAKVTTYSIVGGGGLFLLLYKFPQMVFGINEETVTRSIHRAKATDRFDVWFEAIPEILSKPLLGYGPMHYASVNNGFKYASPHNWFLQFSYEWGIPVALILLSVIGYLFFKAFKNISDDKSLTENYLKIGLVWSCLAVFLHSFISGIHLGPMSQIWLVLIVGTTTGLIMEENKVSNLKKSVRFGVLALVLLGLSGFVVWGISNQMNSNNYQREYLNTAELRAFAPRYWRQGKIGLSKISNRKDQKEEVSQADVER